MRLNVSKRFLNTSVAIYWGAELANLLFGECGLRFRAVNIKIWVVQVCLCSPLRLISSGSRQLFPGIKKPEGVTVHSSTTNAEIKDICFHGAMINQTQNLILYNEYLDDSSTKRCISAASLPCSTP